MIHVYNESLLTTPVATLSTGTTVPFDTVILNTNGNLVLNGNLIQEKVTGVYDTICQICVQNAGSSAVTATLQAYADGKAIQGAFVTTTVGASESQFLTLNWPVNVVSSSSGTATINWLVSGAVVNITNANATVFRHV